MSNVRPPRRKQGWWSGLARHYQVAIVVAIIAAAGGIIGAVAAAAINHGSGSTTVIIGPSAGHSTQVTYAETVGGVAHTWTDYTTGGGSEGPPIGAFSTIRVACRIRGLPVPNDNNSWWYKLASAPWNGRFYTSADAFYNNGRVSGSLVGTPFFDPRVRLC